MGVSTSRDMSGVNVTITLPSRPEILAYELSAVGDHLFGVDTEKQILGAVFIQPFFQKLGVEESIKYVECFLSKLHGDKIPFDDVIENDESPINLLKEGYNYFVCDKKTTLSMEEKQRTCLQLVHKELINRYYIKVLKYINRSLFIDIESEMAKESIRLAYERMKNDEVYRERIFDIYFTMEQ